MLARGKHTLTGKAATTEFPSGKIPVKHQKVLKTKQMGLKDTNSISLSALKYHPTAAKHQHNPRSFFSLKTVDDMNMTIGQKVRDVFLYSSRTIHISRFKAYIYS